MFDVSESAKEELHRILEIRDMEPGKFLRLATPPMWVGEGDFGIVIDEKGAHDQIVEHMDTPVLLVDLELNAHLSESVLDFVESPEGPRFTLDVH